jgi:hypothetical protein
MALTNIELYEELKKTVTEDAARMIAEVIPRADHLATKADLLDVERRLGERFASLERRMFVFFAVPLWGAVAAGIVKLFVR